jgi:acyl-CoA reductase-like NAD-dependent aldehyde dehydrogenase
MVTSQSFTRHSPLDGSALAGVEFTPPEKAAEVLQIARQAFVSWSQTTIESRGRILRKAAALLEERAQPLAEVIRQETGKTISAGLGEISGAVEMGYLVASHGRHPSGYTLPSAIPHRHIRVERIPVGVALLIVTYNAPIPNYAWKTFPALMAGNTAILKPSPTTPHSARKFVEILWEAGVPQDALQLVLGNGDIASALIDGGADLVSFTGSYSTGQKVVQASAVTLAKTVIELGGSNPLIVCADANLEKAADVAVDSAFSNAGQRCSSASRIVVEDSIYQKFRDLFVEKANALKWGADPDANVSTLIDSQSVVAFEEYLEAARKAGATVHRLGSSGGQSPPEACLAQPALVEGLDVTSEIATAEFFGPATRFFSFSTDEEAVSLANDSEYGLTAAVWSSDIARAERMVSRIEAGVISINGPTHGAEINMPFGGVKHSGNGSRDAGVYAIDQYSDVHVVSTFFGV